MVAIPARSTFAGRPHDQRQMEDRASPDSPASLVRQKDIAQYVADMILELRNLAKAADLYTVMVPLECAYYEAFSAANRVDVPPEEIARIAKLSQTLKNLDADLPED